MLSGWGYRKEIRYGTSVPSSSLTDFPKLIKIAADSDIAAAIGVTGGIAVTLADGSTEIPFGLYSGSTDFAAGDIILRAKFSLSSTADPGDVLGYIYYDAGQSSDEDKAGVVSNGYALFMPLEEDPSGSPPQMYDWVSESNVGTSAGPMVSGDSVPAVVSNGLDFSFPKYVQYSSAITQLQEFTVEMILSADTGGLYASPMSNDNGAGNNGWAFWYNVNDGLPQNRLIFSVESYSAIRAAVDLPIDGTHHSVVGVFDSGQTARAYLDGVAGTTTAAPGTTVTYTGAVGRIGYRNNWAPWYGIVSEARVSSTTRSADWLEYAHADDFDNADTFTLGPEEEITLQTGLIYLGGTDLVDVSGAGGTGLTTVAGTMTDAGELNGRPCVYTVGGEKRMTFAAVTSGEYTFSFWFKWDVVAFGFPFQVNICNAANNFSASEYNADGFSVLTSSAQSSMLGAFAFVSLSGVTEATWHHLCVQGGASWMAVYLDGVLIDSRTDRSLIYDPDGQVIGSSDGSNTFKGWFGEPAVWNRRLSESEIEWIADPANTLLGGEEPEPSLYTLRHSAAIIMSMM
jgi:hypothetical protein